MSRFVPKNPKLSRTSQEIADSIEDDGYYFNSIDRYFLEDQIKSESRYKWSGYMSPSAQLTWGMCMRTLIGNARKYLKFNPAFLRKVNMGRAIHEGIARTTAWHPYLRYAPPNLPNITLRRKYERSKPEIPITCDITGWSGKIDDVIIIDGFPGIFDLKTCYIDPRNFTTWVKAKLPKQENVVQVCLYRYFTALYNYYPDDPSHVGLGYLNVMADPAKVPQRWEWWKEWDDELETKAETFVIASAYARREALLGVDTADIKCKNPRCNFHGRRRREA